LLGRLTLPQRQVRRRPAVRGPGPRWAVAVGCVPWV